MHILHYTLGFPPYRSGGLVKYALDLMLEEQELGCDVCALYPGTVSLFKNKCEVIEQKEYKGIKTFEIVNPMPVPLLYGIKSPKVFFQEKGIDVGSFITLLDEFKPDVLHVHTLMGLPKLFLMQAKERNVKLVYTSHDYFGICPLVNLINRNGMVCSNVSNSKECAKCNAKVHDTWFLRLRNMKWVILLGRRIKQIKR